MFSITGLSSINLQLQRKQFKMAALNLLLGSLILAGFNLDLTSSMEQTSCDSVTQLYAQDLDLKVFKDSSTNPLYFRYFTIDLDSNFLFVGAMNRVFGLYLDNIESPSKRLIQDFPATQNAIYECQISGREKNSACQNHIRLLVRNSSRSDVFYMCSTGAYKPTGYQLRLNNNKFSVIDDDVNGLGICPYDPYDNATATYVESGTPGNIPSLFAASWTDSIKADPIIVRPKVFDRGGSMVADYARTIRDRSNWLNEPQFVASFEVGDYVYFFFREVALEYTNCGKRIYSRVARVCKEDYGGNTGFLKNIWTTFVKARLNCSIPGEYPYYFDEIQDVYKIGEEFYGLFTTNVNGLKGSAICKYKVEDIAEVFNGAFKEQKDQQSMWLPVPEIKVPTVRPGTCTKRNTDDLEFANFANTQSLLMDRAVPHMYKKPIFYQSNTLMQKLVVVENVANNEKRENFVFVTASNNGIIYKIAAWQGLTSLDLPKTYMLSQFVPFADNLPIWSLALYKNWVYFGTDWTVGQINLETCEKYKKIDLCIYDPYCGWDKVLNQCRSTSSKSNNLMTYTNVDLVSYSMEEAIQKRVGDLYYIEKLSKISGSSVTMKIEYRLQLSGSIRWRRNGTYVSGDRFIMAQDNSLVVTDLRKSDEGHYTAHDQQARTVAEYTLFIEISKEQIEQRWMRKFDQWCDEFERYQEDIRQWERKCNSCCQDAAALSNIVPVIGGK